MKTNKAGLGIALIVFGVLAGLGNLELISGHFALVVISAGFLGAYFLFGGWNNRASIGFLIPGLIMSSITLFSYIEESNLLSSANDGFLFLMMLGASFLLLMPIHTFRFSTISWGEKYWPVFPGGILALIGLMGLTFGEDRRIWGLVNPLLLIGAGAFILLRPYLKGEGTVSNQNQTMGSQQPDNANINLNKEKL